MSKVIGIMGESGSGKTTSFRNLNPDTVYYIDADGKGLSWKGWRNQYNRENKNYKCTSDITSVRGLINGISEKIPKIKVIIVDTINALMIDDEFKRMNEKGYDKWQDMAASVYSLISESHHYRDDLTIIFTAHTQTERDDSGFIWTRIKTSGKKLDKIVLESKLTTVLLAKCVNGNYIFETKSNNSTAKTPMGAFETSEIHNDINIVLDALNEF